MRLIAMQFGLHCELLVIGNELFKKRKFFDNVCSFLVPEFLDGLALVYDYSLLIIYFLAGV